VVEKGPSKVEQLLGEVRPGSPSRSGSFLTLPGFAYLAALRDLAGARLRAGREVLVILGLNAMLMILLEVPLSATTSPRSGPWSRCSGSGPG